MTGSENIKVVRTLSLKASKESGEVSSDLGVRESLVFSGRGKGQEDVD